MDRKVVETARHFEGPVPEEWTLLGMKENNICRFRYYRDAAGQYWYTAQRMKRNYMQLTVREENGRTYAKNVYTGPRRKRRQRA